MNTRRRLTLATATWAGTALALPAWAEGPSPVKGVLFFDAGSLARDHEDMWSADVELATGLGLRLNLPIGPVRVEYGYNLTRDDGEPTGTFHFAIGNAF